MDSRVSGSSQAKEALKKQESLGKRMKKKKEREHGKQIKSQRRRIEAPQPCLNTQFLSLPSLPAALSLASRFGNHRSFPVRVRFFLLLLLLVLFSRSFPSTILQLLLPPSLPSAPLSPAARIQFASSSLLSRFCCTMTLVPSRLP